MDSFERDGLTFDVHDGGSGTAGTIVALHGFPQRGAMWDAVRPTWEADGYRVVAPDQRGWSPRARPSGTRAYAQRELVADVVALLDALDIGPVHLVGHDWGGTLAWSLAARRPDLLRSLTVLSTPHPAAMRDAAWRGQAARSWYLAGIQVPRLPETVLRLRGGAVLRRVLLGSGLRGESVEVAVEQFASRDGASAALDWYRGLRHGWPEAGRVDVPTVYVRGSADRFLGRAAAQATAAHVDGPYRYVELLGASHWLVEDRPERVARLVLDHAADSTPGAVGGARTPLA